MQAIVDRTRQYLGATELVVDYDHQSVWGAKEGVGGTAKAAGWIRELQVRGDGIWGRVEWTEAAAAAIKAQEYRYLSPVFYHTKPGKIVILQMASLTNTPAFDLARVAASAQFPQLSEEEQSMEKILTALGLAAGSGEDAVLSAVNSLMASSTAIAKALGLKDDAKSEDVLKAVNSAVTDRTKIAKAAGVKDDATADEIVQAVGSAGKTGTPDPAKFVPIEQVTALQADVKKLQESVTGEKAEQAVASAIKDGKLAPALKDWGLDLYRKDAKAFETFTGSAPVLTAPQLRQAVKDPKDGPELDDAQRAVASAMGIDPKVYAETLKAETGETA